MDRILGFFDKPMLINLAIQWVNTVFLAAILSYILYNPVKNFMRKRTERIQNQIDTAESDLKAANQLKVEYELKLREIEAERNEILEAARKRAQDREDAIIKEAKVEAQALKARAEQEIAQEKLKARDEIKTQIIEISSFIAGRYVAQAMDKQASAKLLEESIRELGVIEWQS